MPLIVADDDEYGQDKVDYGPSPDLRDDNDGDVNYTEELQHEDDENTLDGSNEGSGESTSQKDSEDTLQIHAEGSEAHKDGESTPQVHVAAKTYPPPVASMSCEDMVATSEDHAISQEMTSFHGFTVPSHLVRPLERLAAMDMEFWGNSPMLGTEVANAMVKMLGEAMLLMDRSWSSLSKTELEQLVKCVEGARLLQFKVESLWPIAAKAKKLLGYYAAKDRHDALMRKLQEVEKEIARAKDEMTTALGDEDMESAVGLGCQP